MSYDEVRRAILATHEEAMAGFVEHLAAARRRKAAAASRASDAEASDRDTTASAS